MKRSPPEITPFQRLRNACLTDLKEARRMVLAEPALLKEKNGTGETAMHYLAIENQIDAVKALLEWGAEVDAADNFDSTPLLHCVTLKLKELTALLISRGACVSHKDHTGRSPVSEAAVRNKPDILRLVLPALPASVDINSLFDDWDANKALDRGDEVSRLLAERGLRKREMD